MDIKFFFRKTKKILRFKKLILTALFWLLIITGLVVNFIPSYREARKNFSLIRRLPFASYDFKMHEKWGFIWDYIKFIKESTSETAVIAQPHQVIPWLSAEGNVFLMRGFLYPRKLVYGVPEKVGDPQITHALVAYGTHGKSDPATYGWPKFPLLVKKVTHLPKEKVIVVKNATESLLDEDEKEATREVKEHKFINLEDQRAERLILSYTSSSFDWWTKKIRILLSPKTDFQFEIMTNRQSNVASIVKVRFANGKMVTISGSPNQEKEKWEVLKIENLYSKAVIVAKLHGWPTQDMEVVSIGLDTGVFLTKPYLYDWGIAELERGEEESFKKINEIPEGRMRHFLLGNYYLAKKDFDKAILEYKLALVEGEEDQWIYFLLAEAYRQQGKMEKFGEMVKIALNLGPEEPWAHFLLGSYLVSAGKEEMAVEEFKESLRLDPQTPWAAQALAEIYEKRKWKTAAYYYYRQAFEGFEPLVWETKAHQKILEFEKNAREQFSKSKSRLDFANSYFILGEEKKAISLFEEIARSGVNEETREIFEIFKVLEDNFEERDRKKLLDRIEKNVIVYSEGKNGQGIVFSGERGYVAYSLKDYQLSSGTVQFWWKPPLVINAINPGVILEQPRESGESLFLESRGGRLVLGIAHVSPFFRLFSYREDLIFSDEIDWIPNKWYEVTVSWGKTGLFLYLDKKLVAKGKLRGKFDPKKRIYLGISPDRISGFQKAGGIFDNFRVYKIQKFF